MKFVICCNHEAICTSHQGRYILQVPYQHKSHCKTTYWKVVYPRRETNMTVSHQFPAHNLWQASSSIQSLMYIPEELTRILRFPTRKLKAWNLTLSVVFLYSYPMDLWFIMTSVASTFQESILKCNVVFLWWLIIFLHSPHNDHYVIWPLVDVKTVMNHTN